MNEKKQKRLDDMTDEEVASVDEGTDDEHGTHMPDMIDPEQEEEEDA